MENHSPDWSAIKREYIAKTKSIRQLARDFGISDTAIRKRAAAENWGETGSQSGSHPSFKIIEGGGPIPPPRSEIIEPDWSLIYDDNLVVASARRYWHLVIEELRSTDKLSDANLHSVKRLVGHYILADQAALKVAEMQPVITGKRGGLISNPWMEVLKSADAMACAIESELTITPRRRNNGGTVQTKKPSLLGGGYLRSVPARSGNPVGD